MKKKRHKTADSPSKLATSTAACLEFTLPTSFLGISNDLYERLGVQNGLWVREDRPSGMRVPTVYDLFAFKFSSRCL